jgi:hypothetical protein
MNMYLLEEFNTKCGVTNNSHLWNEVMCSFLILSMALIFREANIFGSRRARFGTFAYYKQRAASTTITNSFYKMNYGLESNGTFKEMDLR